MRVNTGYFYFIKEDYFNFVNDETIMKNKEKINGEIHDRSCYFAIKDKNNYIYWMIPISSKVKKYRNIYNKKISRYGKCDTIDFGLILGQEKAFLIQNMCPVTYKYINNEYIDTFQNQSVKIDGILEKRLIKKTNNLLALKERGMNFIYTDIDKIKNILTYEYEQEIALAEVAVTKEDN